MKLFHDSHLKLIRIYIYIFFLFLVFNDFGERQVSKENTEIKWMGQVNKIYLRTWPIKNKRIG